MRIRNNRSQPIIAIVGGGIAGISAAWALLTAGCDVNIFETESMLGGDAYSLDVGQDPAHENWVDGGVSDFNLATFHHFSEFLSEFDVETRPVDQSLSCMDLDRNAVYRVSPGNCMIWNNAEHWDQAFADWDVFASSCKEVINVPEYRHMSVGEYLEMKNFSREFIQNIFEPRAYACFMSSSSNIQSFPVYSLVSFWAMHGIVGDAPALRSCLVNGKQTYCRAFADRFELHGGKLSLNTRVTSIERQNNGVTIYSTTDGKSGKQVFDHVVISSKPDSVLSLLRQPTVLERMAFDSYPSQQADMVIHTDERLMPAEKEAYAAYNILYAGNTLLPIRPNITYWTNRLAGGEGGGQNIYASLNPYIKPNADKIIHSRKMTHPISSFVAWGKNKLIETIQGQNNTWYCGSYLKVPHLHENAFVSGLEVSQRIIEENNTIRI